MQQRQTNPNGSPDLERFSSARPAPVSGIVFGVEQFLRAIRRRLGLFGIVALAVLSFGVLLLLLQSPQYEATATVLVNSRDPGVAMSGDANRQRDPGDVEDEIQILRSRALLEAVARRLGASPAEEAPPEVPGNLLGEFLTRLRGTRDSFRSEVERLARGIRFNPVGRSAVIAISFRSIMPEHAAAVTNAVAEEYIALRQQRLIETVNRATDVLRARVAQLQEEVIAAEQKVEEFRSSRAVSSGLTLDLLNAEMASLSSQVTTAKVERDRLAARVSAVTERVKEIGLPAAIEGLDPSASVHLRDRLADLRQELVALSADLGVNHPKAQRVEAQLKTAEEELESNAMARLTGLETTLNATARHVTMLEARLAEVERRATDLRLTDIHLRRLERDAEFHRSLHQSLLDRLRTAEQLGFAEGYVRVLSPAAIPLRPVTPNVTVTLLASMVFAVGAGLSAILIAEYRSSSTILSRDDAATRLGIDAITLIPQSREARRLSQAVKAVRNLPDSCFSRAVANLFAAIAPTPCSTRNQGRIVLFTSAVQGEGQTTLLAALAAHASAGGLKVVAVDASGAEHSLSDAFGAGPAAKDVSTRSGDSVMHDGNAGVSVYWPGNPPLHAFKTHLVELCSHFDLVLIDAPPVLQNAEALKLAPLADACIMVARWRTTRLQSVGYALYLLGETDANLRGLVLTRVNLAQLATYSFADSELLRRAGSA